MTAANHALSDELAVESGADAGSCWPGAVPAYARTGAKAGLGSGDWGAFNTGCCGFGAGGLKPEDGTAFGAGAGFGAKGAGAPGYGGWAGTALDVGAGFGAKDAGGAGYGG